jgi:eukaryotic-like serine/threonine-protein kinase
MGLAPGTRIGSYEITGFLGAGGMGEVYRAFDQNLGRDIAIKVLSSADSADDMARQRLVREARIASKLNHSNICTVHDVGVADGHVYIGMELVEGEPLSAIINRGALSPDRVVRYATQLADALAHAHERGIVHRDFKSSNVVVARDGRVKVLDFGLAKPLKESASETTITLTAPGTVTGTTAYMAPELLRGAPADIASDIWALGIVLYEMAAGRRPFDGQSVYELTSTILTAPVPPLPSSVPAGLQAIVRGCLAKQPGERYRSASEVRAALEAVGWSSDDRAVPRPAVVERRRTLVVAAVALLFTVTAAGALWWRASSARTAVPAARVRAIAVLPLTDLSGDSAQSVFADGMTEALITDLARIKQLDVISRTSAMRYRNSTKRLPEIARELSVDAIVQGSVLREGNRVRISAQLIEAATDRHLWADEYDRDVQDVLTLQREVARAIAREVRVTLTPQEEAGFSAVPRVDPAAHDLYLQGRELVFRYNEASIAEAIRLLEQSTRVDPQFASAWAALAMAHTERGIWGTPPSLRETRAKAHEALTRALALDAASVEAYTTLGNIGTVYDWDWVGAARALDRALELGPGDARVRNYRASLMMALRQFPEAAAEAEICRRLDPASVVAVSLVGRTKYRARQFAAAIDAYKAAIAMDPTYAPNYPRLADVYIALGRYDEALAWLDKGQKTVGSTRRLENGYGVALALSGRRREAEAIVRELTEQGRTNGQAFYSLAMVETALGNRDAAIVWLNRAYDARTPVMFLVNAELKFDSLRDDPRFKDLLHRMQFPGQ